MVGAFDERFAMNELSGDGPGRWHTSLAASGGLGEKSKSRTDTLNSLRGPS